MMKGNNFMKLCSYCKIENTDNILGHPYFVINLFICKKCENVIKHNYNEAMKCYEKD